MMVHGSRDLSMLDAANRDLVGHYTQEGYYAHP